MERKPIRYDDQTLLSEESFMYDMEKLAVLYKNYFTKDMIKAWYRLFKEKRDLMWRIGVRYMIEYKATASPAWVFEGIRKYCSEQGIFENGRVAP